MDLAGYAVDVTRLKVAPAFDAFDMSSAETEEFGTATVDKQHFTIYGDCRTGSPCSAPAAGRI